MHAMNCKHCGMEDHWTRYCPSRSKIDGKPKKIHHKDFHKAKELGVKVEETGRYGTIRATPHEQAVLIQLGVALFDII